MKIEMTIPKIAGEEFSCKIDGQKVEDIVDGFIEFGHDRITTIKLTFLSLDNLNLNLNDPDITVIKSRKSKEWSAQVSGQSHNICSDMWKHL